MSFILEALKKSDKQRQAETVPKLQSEHGSPVVTQRRMPAWVLLLLLVVLLTVAAVGWFFGIDQAPEPLAVVPAQLQPVQEKLRAENAQPAQRRPEPLLLEAQPVAFASERIYSLEELPGSIRGRFTALHMSLHAYNQEQSAASLVRINNQILREGSALTGGFVLQAITAEGALLRYQGYQFLLQKKSPLDR